MTTEMLDAPLRSAEVLMDPRRLGALQPTRLSAARSIYAKMAREGWQIELVDAQVDTGGAGQMVYRIDANGHIMHLIAFSYEPKLVDRSPRIIGSSWDVEGALIDGEVTAEDIEHTKNAIPRLYAGRATDDTLIWFRANRSIRVFDSVVEALVSGKQPDVEMIAEVGYLLRNTGLDGNGTFGTKDFQVYGSAHPLAIPFHAQLFTAYMMREISADLVNAIAKKRNANAAVLSSETKTSIAVGNGSALGLVLLTMNRPHIVHAWLQGYESLAAEVLSQQITATSYDEVEQMLTQAIDYKQHDETPYEVFPRGTAVAVDLRVLRRTLRWLWEENRDRGAQHNFASVLHKAPSTLLPEAQELFRALMIELAPEPSVQAQLEQIFVNERKQADPIASIAELRSQIDEHFAWVASLPDAATTEKTRTWYKSRNSEEPRSGPYWEVPELTNDLAVDLVELVTELRHRLQDFNGTERVGSFLVANPELGQVVGYVQNLTNSTYAVPRIDVRDTDFVPAHIIRLFNAFCFGLEKTHDVHQRNLRGLIYEGAHFREDLAREANDWRWQVRYE